MATTTLSFNQIAAASSVDMVNSFAQDFSKLREMLAHSQFSVLPNGTNLTVAAKTATLQDGIAAENAEIPASTIVGDASIVTLTYKKYRALIGFERIATEGEGAVVNADNLLRGQLQGDVKQAIADGLATAGNTAVTPSAGDSVQKRCAALWAALSAGRENYATTPVFFANPSAVAEYLGAANITVQTAFGVQYLVNFLGLGTLILSAKIPATSSLPLLISAPSTAQASPPTSLALSPSSTRRRTRTLPCRLSPSLASRSCPASPRTSTSPFLALNDDLPRDSRV